MSKILIDEAVVRQAQMYFNMIATGDNLDWIKHQAGQQSEALRQALKQPAPAPVPEAHKPLTDRYAQTIKDQEAVIHRLQKRYADLEATAVTPTGYAKIIESLIAERDALKAKLAEQPAQQEPDPDELTITYMSGLYEGKKIGAKEEREACAKACEEVERKATKQPPMVGQGCQACAAAIRARGNT